MALQLKRYIKSLPCILQILYCHNSLVAGDDTRITLVSCLYIIAKIISFIKYKSHPFQSTTDVY